MEKYFINQKNGGVTIGGVKQLSEFSREQIVVAVAGGTVAVTGTALRIARFDENEIELYGNIEHVETVGRKPRKQVEAK